MSGLNINNQERKEVSDLEDVRNFVYKSIGLECLELAAEPESAEYCAHRFKLGHFFVRFRVAKITPTKVGQFVTLWKRLGNGPIQPYDYTDLVDFFVINTRKKDCNGQFIFPKTVLCQHDIFSINGKGGKRGIRVYPPWDITESKQAQKTQKWQLDYFLELPQNGEIDIDRARILYQMK